MRCFLTPNTNFVYLCSFFTEFSVLSELPNLAPPQDFFAVGENSPSPQDYLRFSVSVRSILRRLSTAPVPIDDKHLTSSLSDTGGVAGGGRANSEAPPPQYPSSLVGNLLRRGRSARKPAE